MTSFKSIIAILVFGISINAFALGLDAARSSGKVKELPSGYIEAADTSAEVKALVEEVNKKRKKHYEAVAKKNGTDVSTVGAAAADKIKEKLQK